MKVYLGIFLLLAACSSAMAGWDAKIHFVVPNNDFTGWKLTYTSNDWNRNVNLASTVELTGINNNVMRICKNNYCTKVFDIGIKDGATYTVSTKEIKREACRDDNECGECIKATCYKYDFSCIQQFKEKPNTCLVQRPGNCPAGYTANEDICLK